MIPFVERIRRIKAAGLKTDRLDARMDAFDRTLPDLATRVALIELFVSRSQNNFGTGMLFFVMYDIEDHKVRHQVAKYLQRQGCERVQKSIFVGNTDHQVYREIADTLKEINTMYENGDSIMVLPVTRESMTQLNVIGKNLNYEMTINPPHVLIL